MINRTIMRTRVLQVLFAYYMNGEILPKEAIKMIDKSFENTYKLYILLLCLISEITEYASEQVRQSETRATIIHKIYTANRKFIENSFTDQLFNNYALSHLLDTYHLNWDLGINAVRSIYKDIIETDFYHEYLQAGTSTYQQDKKLWVDIFSQVIIKNEVLISVLEEMEVKMNAFNLISDLEVVVSYIIKTIRSFKRDNGRDQELLQVFDGIENIEFANNLFLACIRDKDKYEGYINRHLINWDADRISYVDRLLIRQALAEIFTFDDIQVEVTYNEYIELAKDFSGDRNYIFINGILNEIVNDLKVEQCLPKILLMK